MAISNLEFANVFFDLDAPARPWFISFWGNPKKPPTDGPDRRWGGKPFPRALTQDMRSWGANNYMSISTFRVGTMMTLEGEIRAVWRRKAEQFAALHAILLDDLGDGPGAKVPLAEGLKVRPTSLVETSEGNFQALLKLDPPITDPVLADKLLRGVLGTGAGDQGAGNLTRVCRLPVGCNGKYLDEDGFGRECRLVEFNPEVGYTLEEIVETYGVDLDAIPTKGRGNGKHRGPLIEAEKDPYLKLFQEMGLVMGKPDADGWTPIHCPWEEEHGGGDTSGAGYCLGGGFRCFHSHGDTLNFPLVKEWLQREHDIDTDALDAEMGFGEQFEALDDELDDVETLVQACVEADDWARALVKHKPRADTLSQVIAKLSEPDPKTKEPLIPGGKRALNKAYKEMLAKVERKERKAKIKEKEQALREEGRRPFSWAEIDLYPIADQVMATLRKTQERRNDVLSYGGTGLVTPLVMQPTTVRQARRKHELGRSYPPVLVLAPVTFEFLRKRITQSFAFTTINDEGKPVECLAPSPLVRAILDKTFGPVKLRPCSGLLLNPCVDVNGDLVGGEGYDEITGLYLATGRHTFEIPEKVTAKHARESLRWMREELLAEWCFETPADRDCAVVMFLTAVQRKLIAGSEGCPGFGITSPTQSSGKTSLLQLMSKLVWGRDLPVNSWAESDEEMAKLILAILLEGHPMVAFDNMPEGGAVSSQALSRVMTAAAFSGRVLGENRTAKAPTNVLVALTGNNLVTAGDFNSRLLMISLDTKMERPDQRKFERENLDLWAEEAREEFLGHALRILSYGIARGDHDKAESRFKEWNHLVYAPFLHAGGLSMGPIMERNIASDPALEARRGFLEAWFKCYGDESQQLAEVLKSCGFDRSHDGLMHEDDSPAFRDLKQATELVVPRGYPTPRNLGYALRSFKNKIIGGYVLRDSGREHKTTLWRVEKA